MSLSIENNKDFIIPTCLSLIFIIPFILPWRYEPYPAFFQDTTVIILVALTIFFLALKKAYKVDLPKVSVVLYLMAVYWIFQYLVIDVPYVDNNIKAALWFLMIGTLTWGIKGYFKHTTLVSLIAWSLLIGSTLQIVSIFLQQFNLNRQLYWLIPSTSNNAFEGQIGQRNMLAHYLSWGLLSAVYLLLTKKNKKNFIIFCLILIAVTLSFVNSRTILIYGICLIVLPLFLTLIKPKCVKVIDKRLILLLAGTGIIILSGQLVSTLFIEWLQADMKSGLSRAVSNAGDMTRWYEAKKAWLSFLSAPIFGHGWGGFTYQSYLLHDQVVPLEEFRQDGMATHSHNIITQLLSEMGLVGTIIVIGGLIWTMFYKETTDISIHKALLLGLISITIIHSLLEFPLWYISYQSNFIVFLSALNTETNIKTIKRGYLKVIKILAIIIISYVIFQNYLYFSNYKIFKQSTIKSMSDNARSNALYKLSYQLPLMTSYKDQASVAYLPTNYKEFIQTDPASVFRRHKFHPNPQVTLYKAMYLYNQGNIEEALIEMNRSWSYNPQYIKKSMKIIYDNHPHYVELEKAVYTTCLKYQSLSYYKDLDDCDLPPL